MTVNYNLLFLILIYLAACVVSVLHHVGSSVAEDFLVVLLRLSGSNACGILVPGSGSNPCPFSARQILNHLTSRAAPAIILNDVNNINEDETR